MKMFKEKSTRNSSVEFLRIIAMFMIVLSHSAAHGGFEICENKTVYSNVILDWFTLGNIGVHIFVLISGFYLCDRKTNYMSLRKLAIQVWFYSITIFLVGNLLDYTYSIESIFQAFFPIVFGEYWFITAYMVLILISPILNVFIEKTGQKDLRNIIYLMLTVWIIIPTIVLFQGTLYGNQLFLFILMYLIGGYFKKYPQNFWNNEKKRGLVLCGSFILLYLSSIVIEVVGMVISFAANKGGILYHKNSILIVGIAVSIFSYAIYYKKTYNRVINMVSGCTFGIYLAHENPVMRELIWKRWLNSTSYVDSWFLPVVLLINSVIVFVVSMGIELIWQYLLQKHCLKLGNVLFDRIWKKIEHLLK